MSEKTKDRLEDFLMDEDEEKSVIFYLSPELIREMDVFIANNIKRFPSKRKSFLTEAVMEKLERERRK